LLAKQHGAWQFLYMSVSDLYTQQALPELWARWIRVGSAETAITAAATPGRMAHLDTLPFRHDQRYILADRT
jgi:hypothetical protein